MTNICSSRFRSYQVELKHIFNRVRSVCFRSQSNRILFGFLALRLCCHSTQMMALLGHWLGFTDNNDTCEEQSSAPSSTARPSAQPGIVVSNNKRPSPSGSISPQSIISSSSSSSTSPSSTMLSASSSAASNTTATANNDGRNSQLRKTKSDELLLDFEVMRFLCAVDERLKRHNALLTPAQLDRLQTLHAQASLDNCLLLTDIIDHFEMENDKLRYRLACAAPSSAAADAARSRRNMLVF